MELKLITLDCWGLAVKAKDRSERMEAIAEVLATSNYDVACLQGLWVYSDFRLIRKKVSGNLPYSHYFYSGVIGSGVCILSRFLIEEVFFHQYPVNGYIHKLLHADWYGGKGVGLCRLRINGLIVNIYSAHLHALYNPENDEYLAHRVIQAFSTAQFIQLTSGDADLVVLAGDLNTEPEDLAYRLILNVHDLVDAFTEAGDSVADIYATSECPTNSYTPPNLVHDDGKRTDYVLYRSGPRVKIRLKSYEQPLPNRVPQYPFSYSDHEAVAVRFVIEKLDSERPVKGAGDAATKQALLEESVAVCDHALRSLSFDRLMHWSFTLVLFVLLIVTMVTRAPFGFRIGYNVLRVVISQAVVYTFIMAAVWKTMEKHGIVTEKLSMEVSLRRLNDKTASG